MAAVAAAWAISGRPTYHGDKENACEGKTYKTSPQVHGGSVTYYAGRCNTSERGSTEGSSYGTYPFFFFFLPSLVRLLRPVIRHCNAREPAPILGSLDGGCGPRVLSIHK